VSYGIFGLIDAIDKFDMGKEVKFETYASLRIRGAILDQIRKMDWIPRTIRQRQKQIDAAMKEVEQSNGRAATDEEIAKHIGISEDELLEWQNQVKADSVISLNEYVEQGNDISSDKGLSSGFDTPEKVIENSELKKVLADALELLTDKEKKVILLYYYEELTLKEISRVLDVSESRVSQLHTKALQKMKTKMGNYIGILSQ
jgi:RNA polymerase sigma factor for flagellar operon FliA